MPQSPRRAMSGSLPNLSSHGTKSPSRLPSPRRSVALVQEPSNIVAKRQTEDRKEKRIPQNSTPTSALHSSPRPIRKLSLYNRSGRVLADVNTSSSSRMTPKSKNIQPVRIPLCTYVIFVFQSPPQLIFFLPGYTQKRKISCYRKGKLCVK